MQTCFKRLQKESQAIKTNPDDSIVMTPNENLMKWTAVIKGPPESVYEGYSFKLAITIPHEYPLVPPVIKFITKIFHPNVLFDNGEICLDILKKEWTPVWTLESACRAIIAILSDPAADSPLNCDAGNMIRAGDLRAFRSVARMYCDEQKDC